MEWNMLITPAIQDDASQEIELVELFDKPELNIIDHQEMRFLEGDYDEQGIN